MVDYIFGWIRPQLVDAFVDYPQPVESLIARFREVFEIRKKQQKSNGAEHRRRKTVRGKACKRCIRSPGGGTTSVAVR
jgi:hypothetical protein